MFLVVVVGLQADDLEPYRHLEGRFETAPALRAAEELLKADRTSVPGSVLLGKHLLAVGEYAKAIQVLGRAQQHPAASQGWLALARYTLAEALFCSGKHAPAVDLWRGLVDEPTLSGLKVNPPRLWLAACAVKLGRGAEAEQVLATFQPHGGEDELGLAMERLRIQCAHPGDGRAALAAAEAMMPQAGEDADFLATLAALRFQAGQPAGQVRDLLQQAATAETPSTVANPALRLGNLALMESSFPAALAHFGEAWASARRRRPAIRLRHEWEIQQGAVLYLVATGNAPQACELARQADFVDRPPRTGYGASSSAASHAATAITEALALGDLIAMLRQQRPMQNRREQALSAIDEGRARARRIWLLVQIRRDLAIVQHEDAPRDLLALAPVPLWTWPVVIEALGPAASQELLRTLPVRGEHGAWQHGYLSALSHRGNHSAQAVAATRATLAGLPDEQRLVAAQMHILIGEALLQRDAAAAARHLDAAFAISPPMFRTMRVSVPPNMRNALTEHLAAAKVSAGDLHRLAGRATPLN